jgi:hypothetical protein
VVELLPGKCEALSPNPSIAKKKKRTPAMWEAEIEGAQFESSVVKKLVRLCTLNKKWAWWHISVIPAMWVV